MSLFCQTIIMGAICLVAGGCVALWDWLCELVEKIRRKF